MHMHGNTSKITYITPIVRYSQLEPEFHLLIIFRQKPLRHQVSGASARQIGHVLTMEVCLKYSLHSRLSRLQVGQEL